MSKHLIVGATSGLGKAVAMELLERGEQVICFVRNKAKADIYYSDLPGVEIVTGDAFKLDDITAALRDCTTLFYCINVPYNQWEKYARKLLAVSLEAANTMKVRFIFPGNVYVYGHAQTLTVKESHPHDAHTKKGKIRIEMERMLSISAEEKGLRYTIIRMPDFYGPFVINGFSEKIFKNALEGKIIRWYGSLDIPIEFIYIEDAGKAMVMIGLSDKSEGKSYNVPGHSITSPREFLNEVARQGWKNSKVKATRSSIVVGLAGIFSPLAREFKEMMYLKKERFILEGTLFKFTFGAFPSTPYSLGIKKTLRWMRNFDIERLKKIKK